MSEKEICRKHCAANFTRTDADCYVCNMQEEIAALKAELSSSKQSRDREIMAYDRLNNAFIDLNLECDKLKAELARASEALLREWREKGSFSHGLTVANEIAQEKYKREIAQER